MPREDQVSHSRGAYDKDELRIGRNTHPIQIIDLKYIFNSCSFGNTKPTLSSVFEKY